MILNVTAGEAASGLQQSSCILQ